MWSIEHLAMNEGLHVFNDKCLCRVNEFMLVPSWFMSYCANFTVHRRYVGMDGFGVEVWSGGVYVGCPLGRRAAVSRTVSRSYDEGVRPYET